MVKVATINILFDLTEWIQRREALADGLAAEKADVIALQEVKLPENTGAWLAEKLDMPYMYLTPKSSPEGHPVKEGIAILSRYPFVQQDMIALQSQNRVSQYVQITVNEQPLVFCNGHYYWYPGPHPDRDLQVQQVLDWLGQLPSELPVIAVGDFNGTPDTSAIALMRQHFTSAYAAYHGQEPEYTCPTPLVRRNWEKVLWHAWRNLRFNHTLRPWRGTLDYIFINQHLRVKDCQLILNQPAPNSRTLYPSDHFGIVADLEILR
ncbi:MULTISPECIES: endonuclease/exonuclease/phosphatase family protein [unclassified Leptolyngbya]|uniref:endonuclease/exonuclease/phosphatase family protein n=1 Tax=unclassified Leptolyngbya TaxID=2650499 RepID=UPI001688F908|nr:MULTISPECIES: endonuclease/exonuclease/phosphatase family protein [unclassified Leptolyngbya]MBD1909407.1 endonuclease/exonuclease/phosphatase family protein [Leptolyngbya sp. FACHB-8]MBD2157124.1 endonuclease/exonuclease/phosphatase family protein [Leptolyngbya sp. FACHB-16]